MNQFSETTEHIKKMGHAVDETISHEVDHLCDFAEGLLNGNSLREQEVINIMNFVSISIQSVLRVADDLERKAVKIERLKEKMFDANQRLTSLKVNNDNGNHDKVVQFH